ncbi:hypothetical protein AAHA92_33790 [Salvia divinorum]|uniref:Uncharacterized protein n=1 Tax=Salvia divinorum TaxID=28513 RepID=A0ABD1FJF4_SALDI
MGSYLIAAQPAPTPSRLPLLPLSLSRHRRPRDQPLVHDNAESLRLPVATVWSCPKPSRYCLVLPKAESPSLVSATSSPSRLCAVVAAARSPCCRRNAARLQSAPSARHLRPLPRNVSGGRVTVWRWR